MLYYSLHGIVYWPCVYSSWVVIYALVVELWSIWEFVHISCIEHCIMGCILVLYMVECVELYVVAL